MSKEKEKKIGKPEKGPKLKSIKGRWVLKKINPTMVEVILFEKINKEPKKDTPNTWTLNKAKFVTNRLEEAMKITLSMKDAEEIFHMICENEEKKDTISVEEFQLYFFTLCCRNNLGQRLDDSYKKYIIGFPYDVVVNTRKELKTPYLPGRDYQTLSKIWKRLFPAFNVTPGVPSPEMLFLGFQTENIAEELGDHSFALECLSELLHNEEFFRFFVFSFSWEDKDKAKKKDDDLHFPYGTVSIRVVQFLFEFLGWTDEKSPKTKSEQQQPPSPEELGFSPTFQRPQTFPNLHRLLFSPQPTDLAGGGGGGDQKPSAVKENFIQLFFLVCVLMADSWSALCEGPKYFFKLLPKICEKVKEEFEAVLVKIPTVVELQKYFTLRYSGVPILANPKAAAKYFAGVDDEDQTKAARRKSSVLNRKSQKQIHLLEKRLSVNNMEPKPKKQERLKNLRDTGKRHSISDVRPVNPHPEADANGGGATKPWRTSVTINQGDIPTEKKEEEKKEEETENELKFCNFEQLIEHVTSASAKPRLAMEFLLTYRTICTPEELLNAVIKRYNDASNGNDVSNDAKNEVIMLRCFVLLRTWIDKHGIDFDKNKEELLRILTDWKNKVEAEMALPETTPDMAKSGSSLLQKISYFITRKPRTEETWVKDATFLAGAAKPILVDKSIPVAEYTLMDIDSVELSRQITLIEEALWKNVDPTTECLGQAWTKKDKEEKAPNVLKFISHFNEMNHWVQTEILTEVDSRRRVKVLSKFVEVAELLLELNNFNGALEIISGINSTNVFRLKKTMGSLSKHQNQAYERVAEAVNSKGNYSVLRTNLKTLMPPCIPYLGMYLTDLTFMEDANKETRADGLINWQRRKMVAATILEIKRYQQECYCFLPVVEIQTYLSNARKIPSQDTLYSFSMYVEPREGSERPPMPQELELFLESKPGKRAKSFVKKGSSMRKMSQSRSDSQRNMSKSDPFPNKSIGEESSEEKRTGISSTTDPAPPPGEKTLPTSTTTVARILSPLDYSPDRFPSPLLPDMSINFIKITQASCLEQRQLLLEALFSGMSAHVSKMRKDTLQDLEDYRLKLVEELETIKTAFENGEGLYGDYDDVENLPEGDTEDSEEYDEDSNEEDGDEGDDGGEEDDSYGEDGDDEDTETTHLREDSSDAQVRTWFKTFRKGKFSTLASHFEGDDGYELLGYSKEILCSKTKNREFGEMLYEVLGKYRE